MSKPTLVLALAAAVTPFATACTRGKPAARPSLLLVTVDTLRADRVSAYGAPADATPHLLALAKRGMTFEEALASVPLTLPSHATILSGLEPPRHGVRDNGSYVFPAARETLATRLKAEGYSTAGFVGAYVLDRRFGLARSFDHYDDRIQRKTEGASVLESERRCEEVAAAAADWIGKQAGPFFAWVHFYDPHAPYDAPSAFRDRFPGRPYEAEVAYVDDCFGRVLAAAQARAGERLVSAVTADHGEGLGEHGESGHGLFLYQSTLRVPFILAGPGLPRGERRGGLARTRDVSPTLLARLSLEKPEGLDGVDLLRGSPPREAYAETLYPASFGWAPLRAWRLGSLKYIDAPRPELYDLAADPQEARDLGALKTNDAERLSLALAAFRKHEEKPAPRAADAAVREQLRALGYVTGGTERSAPEGRKDPKDALPLWQEFERATAAEMRGERDLSIAGFRTLVERDPANMTFRRRLVLALRRAGQPGKAADVLEDLERLAPDDAAAWHDLAAALDDAGRIQEAIHAEERSTRLKDALPEAFSHLGILLARQARLDEALGALDRATNLDPNNARAWSNRANVLRGLGRNGDAEADYRRAATLAPWDPDPVNGLGVLAVEQDRLEVAADAFRRVLLLDERHHEARLNLAVVAARRGDRELARQLAARVAADVPKTELGRKARSFLAER